MLYIIIVGIYAVYQVNIFLERNGAEITMSIESDHFTDDDEFGYEQGLAIAVGFSDSNDSKEVDPRFGKLIFYASEWYYDENDAYIETYTEIPSHQCTNKELGLEGDNPRFMPISDAIKV